MLNGEHLVNSAAGLPLHPLGKLPGSVWSIPSEPLVVPDWLGVDHFAAFPQEWPRRLILGWSPSGICTACNEGRRPVVAKELVGVWHDKAPQDTHHGDATKDAHQHNLMGKKDTFGSTEATITGYACACTPYTDHPERRGKDWRANRDTAEGARPTTQDRPTASRSLTNGPVREHHFAGWKSPATRPAVILDPFGGTGTVAMVARALGRTGISVDLSADYSRLAKWRIFESGHASKARRRTNEEAQGAML